MSPQSYVTRRELYATGIFNASKSRDLCATGSDYGLCCARKALVFIKMNRYGFYYLAIPLASSSIVMTNRAMLKEYSAVKVIPMAQVIDAAEVDPMSRSKHFCLQIIAEEKSYRLCAPDEESLAKWLGALKSILVARKKLEPAPGAAGLR